MTVTAEAPSRQRAYGVDGHLPGQRTLILAADARASSIRDALLARRTSASARPGDRLHLLVDVGSGTEPLTHLEIVSDNGVGADSYYGDNSSWSSFHSQLTPSHLVQHERYVASGGHATRKARID